MVKKQEVGITVKKKEDFSEWYVQVILKSELADYTSVSGSIVYRPRSYAIWEKISRGVTSSSLMLDSIQIEVTSRCFLKCVMCPNITLPKWDSRDMDFETFTKISKYFPYAKLIYLQEWGENLCCMQQSLT